MGLSELVSTLMNCMKIVWHNERQLPCVVEGEVPFPRIGPPVASSKIQQYSVPTEPVEAKQERHLHLDDAYL